MRRAVLAVLALLALNALPAHGASLQTLDDRSTQGPVWVAYRVHVASAPGEVNVGIEPQSQDAAQVAYGLYELRASDAKTLSFFIGTGDTAVTEAHAHDAGLGVDLDVPPMLAFSGATSGFSMDDDALAAGDSWFVVVNTAPSAGAAHVFLQASPGVSLAGVAQGTAGGLFRETDFAGAQNVQVRVGGEVPFPGLGSYPARLAQVGTITDGHVRLAVQHHLFGIFQSLFADPNEVGYVLPDGTERSGDTTYVLSNKPAGAYDFQATSWQAKDLGPDSAYIALLVADVELP
jgi:hypothetical protein